MKNSLSIRKVALALFGLAIVIAGWLAVQRMVYERHHRNVELVVGYDDVQKMSRIGGVPEAQLLPKLRHTAGVTAIALGEDTLETLVKSGKVTMMKGADLINLLRVGQVNPFVLNPITAHTPIREAVIYLIVDESVIYERIRDYLVAQLGPASVTEVGYGILKVSDDEEDLLETGVGLSIETAQYLESFGFHVVPRFRNGHRVRAQVIDKKLAALSALRSPAAVIFEGDSVLGYPNQLSRVAQRLKQSHFTFGYLEFFEQLGERNLAGRMPQYISRVHSIHELDLATLPMGRAVERYARAVRERNVRVLYVRPYLSHYSDENVVAYNLRFIRQIEKTLKRDGFQPNSVARREAYPTVRTWQSAGMTLGLSIAVVGFAGLFVMVSIRAATIMIVAMTVLSGIWGLAGWGLYWNQLMALLAALIFPPLAIITQFPKHPVPDRGISRASVGYVAKLVGICLLGALFVVGFLVNPLFAFGIRPFFGVKIAFLLPLLLIGLYYYLNPQRMQSIYFVVRRLLASPVRSGVLLAVGLFGIALAVYIIRSGNDAKGEVSALELLMREGLERLLTVRPRTKEFLIGYPFLILTYLYVDRIIARKWLWFFNGLGAVALISLINAFCHIHTPLGITLLRCVLGAVLGVGVGFVYAIAFKWLRQWGLRWVR
ncbi:MAG: DUF5693 family protein [Candidatus Margulisiibacteriota bacterium]